jgi:hypothetical protein
MLDMDRIHAWAWDARPWPYFPNNSALWADSPNYARGHWIGGRITAQSLAEVVKEVCLRAGLQAVDVSELSGLVRGYVIDNISSARAALQPLMLAHGFEAVERNGTLVFRSRRQEKPADVDRALFAVDEDLEGVLQITRAPNAELSGRVQLRYIEEGGDYATRSAEALFPDETSSIVSQSSFPISLTYSEGKAIVERWLAESRVARETARFALPPSRADIKAGDTLKLPNGSGGWALYRVDRIEEGLQRSIDAVRVSDTVYTPSDAVEELPPVKPFSPPVPVFPVFLDLPLITGDEVPHAPHLAVTARPWPGSVAVYGSPEDSGYELEKFVGAPSTIGVTQTDLVRAQPGVWDLGAPLRVKLTSGQFNSVEAEAVLRGANLVAIGSGTASGWELFQFKDAELVAPDTFELSNRLRGQLGTEADMAGTWPVGSLVVLISGAVEQVALASQAVGLPRHYRIGPAQRPIDDQTYIHVSEAFSGIGLRPYAPVHLAARSTGDDVRLGFVRRTRADGDRWDLEDVPLGEATERYLVRVRALDETLLREITITQTVWDYTAAMRAEDGSPAGVIFEVAQISDRFGPGSFGRIFFYG